MKHLRLMCYVLWNVCRVFGRGRFPLRTLRRVPDADTAPALPTNKLISSNYLGTFLMEMLKLSGVSEYWQYAADTMAHWPVLLTDTALAPDGSVVPLENTVSANELRNRVRSAVNAG